MLRKILVTVCCIGIIGSLASCGSRDTQEVKLGELPETYSEEWAGDEMVVQDLGDMELSSWPVDSNYDWKFSVMKDGDMYKMWWCRQYNMDAIWYAESTDLKHWENEQVVLEITPETYYDRDWVKVHVGNPDVIKVDGTYYMYFEAPATILSSGECDNNVFLATSEDGIHFTMYPDNENPQPIIKMPAADMGQGKYGIGQPTVSYVNGTFYLWYTDSLNVDALRMATSTDGIQFGEYEDHPVVFDRATVGVKYNAAVGNFVMAYSINANRYVDSGIPRNSNVYLNFSEDGINWDVKSCFDYNEDNRVSSDKVASKGYADFVTDEFGQITTDTMYVTYMEAGYLPDDNEDFRVASSTWDGHIAAVNLKEYAQKEMILPNGAVCNEENLKTYEDSGLTYEKSSSTAKYGTPVIDLEKEDMWEETPVLSVNRLTGKWASLPSDTTAEIQVMWDEEATYFYGVVTDENVSYSYPGDVNTIYQRDSVDMFINVSNNQTRYETDWDGTWADFTADVIGFSVCADGTYRVINSGGDITAIFDDIEVCVKITDTGWEYEAKVPWYPMVKSKVEEDRVIGLELQINDDPGVGYRTSMIVWNDLRAAAFQNLDCLGDLKLVK